MTKTTITITSCTDYGNITRVWDKHRRRKQIRNQFSGDLRRLSSHPRATPTKSPDAMSTHFRGIMKRMRRSALSVALAKSELFLDGSCRSRRNGNGRFVCFRTALKIFHRRPSAKARIRRTGVAADIVELKSGSGSSLGHMVLILWSLRKVMSSRVTLSVTRGENPAGPWLGHVNTV